MKYIIKVARNMDELGNIMMIIFKFRQRKKVFNIRRSPVIRLSIAIT